MSFMPRPAEFATAAPAVDYATGGDPIAPLRLIAARVPSPPLVIGLTGPGGVGKSTIARAIVALSDCETDPDGFLVPTAEIVHTAAPFKRMLAALYGAAGLDSREIGRRIDGDLKRKPDPVLGGVTPTHAMQTLGTEWGRQLIGPDLWVDLWRRQAERLLDEGRGVLNDSVRFENEAEAIRTLGGVVVQLTDRAGDLAASHASEAGVAPDLIVENSGTPEECARDVLEAVEVFLGRRQPEPPAPGFWPALRALWGRVAPSAFD
ncbi:hypothetical protein RCCRONUS_24 [Rhodobacter phage RcCronus]|uniref:Uncharacterized protein n=1 Tax=Rhodobacter phage RcCronus TaxID=1662333 RepID=A0A0K1LM59_9CAUD|nr:hypothetical protein FDI78_gp24 [Rhodobacter phage RcCronus]AKU43313.1 hypothetical protein RCCRONUS_24 [Rhodobacter phage RcCronus]